MDGWVCGAGGLPTFRPDGPTGIAALWANRHFVPTALAILVRPGGPRHKRSVPWWGPSLGRDLAAVGSDARVWAQEVCPPMRDGGETAGAGKGVRDGR